MRLSRMASMQHRSRSLPVLVAVLVVGLGLGLGDPARVLASCLQLDLASIPRTDSTSVFTGTVLREQEGHVFMRVDAWFLGADPVEAAEVVGGKGSNDPGVITSVDWTPQPGENYLIVAERAAQEGFATQPCQQIAVDAAVLQEASSVFGAPLEPPFAQPGSPAVSSPTVAPGASSNGDPAAIGVTNDSDATSGLRPLLIGAVLLILVAAGLLGWALRRPKPTA
jgi:hypothetical protein